MDFIKTKRRRLTNNSVTVEVTDETGNAVNLVDDYLLFYCEYRNTIL